MKKLVKKVFNAMGMELMSSRSYDEMRKNLVPGYAKLSYAWEAEDLLLESIFQNLTLKTGFYVDIGAHHPWHISNTAKFYKNGWCGINVEPNPDNFTLFEQERSRDINLNVGASNERAMLCYYMFNGSGLNTFVKEKVDQIYSDWQVKPIREIEVAVMPINEILAYSDGHEIDLLTIDVETMEYTILSALDFSIYQPKVIVVELLFTALSEVTNNNIYQLLINKGYFLSSSTLSTFFFIRNDFKKLFNIKN